MKQWKKIVCFLQICALVLTCLSTTGCSSIVNQLTEELGWNDKLEAELDKRDMDAIICKASDFESVKDNWYGFPSLLSKKAKAISTNEVVMEENYYVVLTLDGFTKQDGGRLEFSLRSWSELYCGNNAVTLDDDNIVVDGDINWTYDDSQYGTRKDILQFSFLSDGLRDYIAIPFTPKRTGILYVDCTTVEMYTAGGLCQLEEHLCATVKNTGKTDGTAEVTIANLSYGVITQQAYESGQLEGITDLSSISNMSAGDNYLVVDFDIVSQSDIAEEIYCGFYLHRGNWSDAEIEAANTSKHIENNYWGGKFFDFAYTSLPNNSKKVRIILGFTAPEASAVDFEFFVYADQALVNGTTQACGSIVDSGASQLKYRLDKEKSVYYVTGYEAMTGMVVIPEYYQGYPVTGVEKNAFSNCSELTVLNLNKVKQLPSGALDGCTGLNLCDPYNVDMSILRRFSGSYSMDKLMNYTAQDPDDRWHQVTTSPTIMPLGEKSYWMVDLYVSRGDTQPKNLSFSLRCDKGIDCEIVLKQAIGTGVWAQSSTNASNTTVYIMQAQRLTHVRLIFEVIPRSEGTGGVSFWIHQLWVARSASYSFRIK